MFRDLATVTKRNGRPHRQDASRIQSEDGEAHEPSPDRGRRRRTGWVRRRWRRSADAAAGSAVSDEHHEPLREAVTSSRAHGMAAPHDAPIAGPKGAGAASPSRAPRGRSIASARGGDNPARIAYDALVSPPARSTACCRCFRRAQRHYYRTGPGARSRRLDRSKSLLVIGGVIARWRRPLSSWRRDHRDRDRPAHSRTRLHERRPPSSTSAIARVAPIVRLGVAATALGRTAA